MFLNNQVKDRVGSHVKWVNTHFEVFLCPCDCLPLALKRGDWESTQQQPVIQLMKLSKDDVKAMYSHGNLRDRALLLVLAQSSSSEVDVSCLRIEELKGHYENPETAVTTAKRAYVSPALYCQFKANGAKTHLSF